MYHSQHIGNGISISINISIYADEAFVNVVRAFSEIPPQMGKVMLISLFAKEMNRHNETRMRARRNQYAWIIQRIHFERPSLEKPDCHAAHVHVHG
jgi:hypothetical protein